MDKSQKELDVTFTAYVGMTAMLLFDLVMKLTGIGYSNTLFKVFLAVCFGFVALNQITRLWMYLDMKRILPAMHYVKSKDDAFRFVSKSVKSYRVMVGMMIQEPLDTRRKDMIMLIEAVACVCTFILDQTLICCVLVISIWTFTPTERVRMQFRDDAIRIHNLSKEK